MLSELGLSNRLADYASISYSSISGKFYVADGGESGADMLYELDIDTGNLSAIGSTSLPEGVVGLVAIPEPATLTLLASAAWRCCDGGRGKE